MPAPPDALALATEWAARLRSIWPCMQVEAGGTPAGAWVRVTMAVASVRAPRAPGSLASLYWGTFEMGLAVSPDETEERFQGFRHNLMGFAAAAAHGPDAQGALAYLGEAYQPGQGSPAPH